MNTSITSRSRQPSRILVGPIAAFLGLSVSANSHATIVGPYTAVANTVHLWHCDEALVGGSPYNDPSRL